MKKTFLYVIAAIVGICAGIIVNFSFMIVEAEGTKMIPTIVPEQNVLVNLVDKDIEDGDLVAYRRPFYTLDGEGIVVFRRVKKVKGDEITLTCDMEVTVESDIIVSKEDILGKVVLINID